MLHCIALVRLNELSRSVAIVLKVMLTGDFRLHVSFCLAVGIGWLWFWRWLAPRKAGAAILWFLV